MAVSKDTKKEDVTGSIRPPVVVVMGHVDHGKSTLLEAIREDFRITGRESGGITQHIGAYEAGFEGRKLTFIDTPGHEAFSAMRSRGADVADIALLVVAADEGVKPQTVEALEQIHEAKLPFIVVINKMDKPGADPDKIKQELTKHNVFVESWGGTISVVETAATKKEGIEGLLELILLMVDVEELEEMNQGPGKGVIIESFLDSKRGTAATILVQKGLVRTSDFIATQSTVGKVRILENFQGDSIEEAETSQPALVIGFDKGPEVGEEFQVFEDKASAAEFVSSQSTIKQIDQVDDLDHERGILSLVLKSDVSGSLEALNDMIAQLPQENAVVRVVGTSVGEVGENDVRLAEGTDGVIIAFRSKVSSQMADLAERLNVPIEEHDIIYKAVEAVERLSKQRKEYKVEREDMGEAKVLAVFRTVRENKGFKQVVGGKVSSGEIRTNMKVSVERGEEQVCEGRILNLQHNKADTGYVPQGEEFGISLHVDDKMQEGDILKFYVENEV